jgi:rod shape-determining protein MreD
MGFFVTVLLVYLALALQATVVQFIGIAGIRPDLPLIATVLLALTRGSAVGTSGGFLIGLGQDITNPAFLGLNALTKSVLGYSLGTLRERFDAAAAASYAAILFVGTIAHDLLYLTVYTRLVLPEMMLALVTRTLPTAVYTAGVGIWVFMLVAAVSGRRSHRVGRSRLASR